MADRTYSAPHPLRDLANHFQLAVYRYEYGHKYSLFGIGRDEGETSRLMREAAR